MQMSDYAKRRVGEVINFVLYRPK